MKKNLLIITFISVVSLAFAETPNSWVQKNDVGFNIPGGPTARFGAVSFSIGSKGYLGTGYDGNYKKDFWEYDPTSNTWTQKSDFGGNGRWLAVGFNIGSKGYIGTGQVEAGQSQDFYEYDPGSNTWTQKADFAGPAREASSGFSIGAKGYIGTGWDGFNYTQDFWEYDPSSDSWLQKADYAGGIREGVVGLTIGSYGYFGTGYDGNSYQQDFWEYDPITDTWLQKTNFGGNVRTFAAGFSIGTKGYIGTGAEVAGSLQDFWEYDQTSDTWNQKANFAGPVRYWATGFSIGSKGYLGTGTDIGINFQDFLEFDPVSDVWTQKENFGGVSKQRGIGFSIATKGYIGTGYNGIAKQDFWEYESGTGTWTQKADFAGNARYGAVGFNIGNKGYVGTGTDGGINYNDFWEYDPGSNTWTQKANFIGTERNGAAGFSIGTKGYIGTGNDGSQTKDFYEYNQATDSWTQIADLTSIGREGAVGFSIGTKGYVGTGVDADGYKKDFWEYNPVSNAWTQKANLGGDARWEAVGFSISNSGYIGTGTGDVSNLQDFWEYNPGSDTWAQKADFASTSRFGAVGFGIGANGFIGTGFDNISNRQDFWEYFPDISSTFLTTSEISGSPFCAGVLVNVAFTTNGNFSSGNIFTAQLSNSSGSFTAPIVIGTLSGTTNGTINATIPSNLSSGTGYRIRVVSSSPALTGDDNGSDISILASPLADASSNSPRCSGNTINLYSSGGTSYSWTGPGGYISVQQNPTRTSATPAMSGTYAVRVTNSSGCTSTASVNVVVNPLPGSPSAITGTSSILRGGTYTYTATISNATSYIWTYSGNGATISGNTNPVAIKFSCNATNGNLTVRGSNNCGNGPAASVAITTNPGSTINIYSAKLTVGSGHYPTTVKTAIMPVNVAGSNKGFKIFRSNLIGIQAKRKNYSHIWHGDCSGVSGYCNYNPASNITALVNVTGPVLSNYGGSPAYKYVMTVPAGQRYLVIAKDDATQVACSNDPYGVSPCYVYPGKRTFNRNNHHNQCDEDDDGDDDGDDDNHFQSCDSKDMFLQIIEDANGKIRPSNTDAIPGSLLLISSPNYMEFTDSVELLPIVYESVDGSWDISTMATPPEGFFSIPDSSIETTVTTSTINTLQFTLVDTGSVWTMTQVKTQLKHNGRDITNVTAPYMIDSKKPIEYLSQNEPNPFSNSTSIPYILPSESQVRLSIYDVYGREIAVLVNGVQQKGLYKETWNACENDGCTFNAGIYFISLQATRIDNGKTILNSRSMIYMK